MPITQKKPSTQLINELHGSLQEKIRIYFSNNQNFPQQFTSNERKSVKNAISNYEFKDNVLYMFVIIFIDFNFLLCLLKN